MSPPDASGAPATRSKLIGPGDFARVAQAYSLPLAVVLTCDEMETGGMGGFLPSGLSRGLFEAKPFSMRTRGRFDKSHPTLSCPTWNRSLYKGGQHERDRLDRARELDEVAGLESFSWGRFQIMGFNARLCGWEDVRSFAFDMDTAESYHLEAWAGFVSAKGLMEPLRRGQFETYWRIYNGPAYAENAYGTKFMSILARRTGQADTTAIGKKDMLMIGMRGPRVKALQAALNRALVYFGALDGVFGQGTQRAVMAFQRSRLLAPDGVAGPATLEALG